MIKEKILKFLIENRRAFSINEISKEINTDYKLVYINIFKLKNLIEIQKLGNSNQCRYNNNYNYLVQKVEEERRKEILTHLDINVIYSKIQINPFFIFLLFGSYAKKKQKKSSDIDFCLITNDEAIKKEIQKTIRLIPLRIHLITFTYEQFRQLLTTTENNVGKEILNNYVVLKGIENFYELIKVG